MEDAPRHSEMDLRDAAQRRISALSGRAKTTQNRFSLFFSMRLRVSTLVGPGGRLLLIFSALRAHQDHLQPGAIMVLPGDSTAASRGSSGSSSGSGQTERKDYIERRRMDRKQETFHDIKWEENKL